MGDDIAPFRGDHVVGVHVVTVRWSELPRGKHFPAMEAPRNWPRTCGPLA